MVRHQLWLSGGVGRLAPDLGRVRAVAAGFLVRGCAGTRDYAGIAVVRSVADQQGDLRAIATDLLAGDKDVGDAVGRKAVTVGLVRLRALRHVPYPGVDAGRGGAGRARGKAEGRRITMADTHGNRCRLPLLSLSPLPPE